MKTKKYYTLIGSRKTPQDILNILKETALFLEKENWIVRSGNANGSDQCANITKTGNREIYLPYNYYNMNNIKLLDNINAQELNLYNNAKQIVLQYHPNKNLSNNSLLYLTRDIFQVLGKDLNSPSEFILCWTPDGAKTLNDITQKTGGTGMALRIACLYNIPIINLANKNDLNKIKKRIGYHK